MNSVTIKWGYIPWEVRDPVRRILVQYLWLVPAWCRLLHVNYWGMHSVGEHVPASSDANVPYRFASIHIHASWLTDTENQRRLSVIHEVLHIPFAPMVKCHQADIDTLCPEAESPKYRAKLVKTWTDSFEGTIQDLTHALLALPAAALPRVDFTEEEDEPPRIEAT